MNKIKIKQAPLHQSEASDLIVTVSKEELIDAFKTKYVREFVRMDDRAYFISGILIDVIDELLSISTEPPRANKLLLNKK